MEDEYVRNRGYVRLKRSLLDWEWYCDGNTARVFLHLLLTASFRDGRRTGVAVKAGDCITSIRILSDELCMSQRSVRTALKHLISTQEVTQKKYPRFTVFTIEKYGLYGACDTDGDSLPTRD